MSSNKNDCLKNALDMALEIVPQRNYGGFWSEIRKERREDDLLRFTIFVNLSNSICDAKFNNNTKEIVENYKSLQSELYK